MVFLSVLIKENVLLLVVKMVLLVWIMKIKVVMVSIVMGNIILIMVLWVVFLFFIFKFVGWFLFLFYNLFLWVYVLCWCMGLIFIGRKIIVSIISRVNMVYRFIGIICINVEIVLILVILCVVKMLFMRVMM